jgi:hypothetical protein
LADALISAEAAAFLQRRVRAGQRERRQPAQRLSST